MSASDGATNDRLCTSGLRTIAAGGSRFRTWLAAALVLAVLAAALASLLIGSGDTSPARALGYLLGSPGARADPQLHMVVTTLRLPRTLAALVVGTALGVAGALLQAATRNPLAETGLLGVNAGGALGVVVGITFGAAATGLQRLSWAFVGAMVVSTVVLLIATTGRGAGSPLRLVLAGAALGATIRGITSYLLLGRQASYDEYRSWVLGSLSGISGGDVLDVTPFVLAGLVLAVGAARPLSALSLGDESARSLGHRPRLIRTVVAVAVTVLTAASVAVAGPIAFVGLLAPYLARAIAGTAMAAQVVLSGLAGAFALLAADIVARVVIKPYEAPVAVLLALIGAPVLIMLARSRRLLTLGASRQGGV